MAEWMRGVTVGEWYAIEGDTFEIVGVDSDNEVVLVQHFDGTLEEYDFESWMELKARPAAAPEDWSGAMDVSRSDLDSAYAAGHADRWEDPLDLLDQRHS